MPYLDRSQILAQTHGFRTEEMDVPEWGGAILVRELTAMELTKLGTISARLRGEARAVQGAPDLAKIDLDLTAIADLFPEVVSWCVVDEEMKPILTEADVRGMTGASVAPIQRIITKAVELTGVKDKEPDPNA